MSFPRSTLDPGQIIKDAYDEAAQRIRVDAEVTATIGDVVVEIDAATGDNIAIANSDGSKKVDVETVNGKNGLDVNVISNGFSSSSNTRPSISNSSSTILAANPNRKYAYVFNQTGGVVYLKLGTTAALNEGIRLVNNAMYEILTVNLWLGSITAIKSGAGSVNLDVFEGTP